MWKFCFSSPFITNSNLKIIKTQSKNKVNKAEARKDEESCNFLVCSELRLLLSYKAMIKKAFECENISEIRTEIDAIDKEIVGLLGQRFEYVKAASKFKTSETSVKAPERFKAMLEQRRVWASEEGLNADAIEKLFKDLVTHFIEEEMKHWKENG
jgi:isochorismate pyruvate lyase